MYRLPRAASCVNCLAIRCRSSPFVTVHCRHYSTSNVRTPLLRPNILTCRVLHAIVLIVRGKTSLAHEKRRRCTNTNAAESVPPAGSHEVYPSSMVPQPPSRCKGHAEACLSRMARKGAKHNHTHPERERP